MGSELIDQAIEHHEAGRYDQAAALYQRILEASPRHADALHLLGVVAYQQGNDTQAVELIGQAIEVDPSQGAFHNMMGLVLCRLGRLKEAEVCLRVAVDREPGLAQAHHNLGKVFQEQSRFQDAADSFTLATGIDPSYLNAHVGLGDAYQSLGEFESAVASYERALGLDGQRVEARYGQACALRGMGDYAGALAGFRSVLEIDSGHGYAHHNLGQVLFKLGQIDQAIEQMRTADLLLDEDLPRAAIAVMIPGSPQADHWAIAQARRVWGDVIHRTHQQAKEQSAGFGQASAPGNRPLRVGYVSAFFGDRNWMKPVWGLINHHDRGRVSVHLFSDAGVSRTEYGYKPHETDTFHDTTGLSNQQVADLIKENRIDILVDLNGYSKPARLGLFVSKPAPIIVGWFNLFATTGLDCFDYLIGDQHVIPPDEEAYYTEKIVRVGGCYLTFEVAYPVPEVAPPPCLDHSPFTFGCLAPQHKITTEVIGAWSRILESCPDSRLMIKNKVLGKQGNRGFVHDVFSEFGVDPNRIIFEGGAEHYTYLEAYHRVDLALDTFPYSGGTTTMEALWQGVPVITFPGDRWVSRTSTSILRYAGLGDYVAADLDGYIHKAVGLAGSSDTPARLAKLRQGMRWRLGAAPVCDTSSFAGWMEDAYEAMWKQRSAR